MMDGKHIIVKHFYVGLVFAISLFATTIFADGGGRELDVSDAISYGQSQGLSESESRAIWTYTTEEYSNINSTLRKIHSAKQSATQITPDQFQESLSILMDTSQRTLQLVDEITQGLQKLPAYLGNVDRGTTLPPDVLLEHQVGRVVIYAAFTSTSLHYNTFRSNHHLKIQSVTGREVTDFSKFSDEREILFMPGTRFCVINRKTTALDEEISLVEWTKPGPVDAIKNCHEQL